MKLNRIYHPTIPLHVYMTWNTKELPPLMLKNVTKLSKQNPEFTFHLYDDAECRQFIQTHFRPEVVDAFDKLIPGAYKADLWRLCILYINGGYYMDIKLEPVGKFKLIELSEGEHLVLDRPNLTKHIYNAFMICKAKHPFLLKCINCIVHNTETEYYGSSCLSPTGPELLGAVHTHYNGSIPIDLIYPHKYPDHIMYKGRLVLRNYVGYREEQRKYHGNYYGTLWNNRKIYKSNENTCATPSDV